MSPEDSKFIESLMHWHAGRRDDHEEIAIRIELKNDTPDKSEVIYRNRQEAQFHRVAALGLYNVLKRNSE